MKANESAPFRFLKIKMTFLFLELSIAGLPQAPCRIGGSEAYQQRQEFLNHVLLQFYQSP